MPVRATPGAAPRRLREAAAGHVHAPHAHGWTEAARQVPRLLGPGLLCSASPEWTPAGTDGRDPLHLLLHELGHALGLDHSNLAGAECPGVEGGNGQPNAGVMWSKVPAFAAGRRLLRDDIEALGSIWGTSDPSSLWHWDDAAWFPHSPDACSLAPLGGTSGVPVSVSSAVDGFEADIAFRALTDARNKVRVLEGSASAFPMSRPRPCWTRSVVARRYTR